MNIYLLVILIILVGEYLLDVITEWLNIRRLSPAVPGPFKGYYDEEKYARSQAYSRETTKFGLLRATFSIAITIPFILGGGFNYVDRFVRSFELGSIVSGLVYIFILAIGTALLELPFNIYDTFVIEEKYGFNKTTFKTFIADLLKGLVLAMVIGGPILAVMLWFFEKTGRLAPLYIWSVVFVIQLIMNFVAPYIIFPLFNKFSPLEEGELKTAVENYAREHNFHLKGVYKMDGSKRSTRGNAAFFGFGKARRIILYDTLIEKHTTDELVAVLAHEMGHYKLHHIIKSMVVAFLETGLMFFILSLFINNKGLFAAFKMEELSIYASFIFFGFLYTPVSILLSIVTNIFERKWEYEADRYAVTTTGKKEALITGLKKLSVDNLSNLTPHPLKVFFYYSHPPILERISAIENIKE
ncbi:MAG TPA: M48 family metallopeptidase [Candidatus Deferrimicrobium sp.]|nr:M48 family metallopeptidase [Candidatus Deferrimicrobium sp.]